MTEQPRLFGADYSVYVRIVRLCLIEKGIGYHLVPVDVFAEGGTSVDYLARHPFGRIPAFEHDGFSLYETGAIARYIDEAFEGPKLQPSSAAHRARCNQLISIADNYAYPQLVWGVYVERVSKPGRGVPADEEKIAVALAKARVCLTAMSDLMGDTSWLVGEQPTLADLYAAPMFDYFFMTPEGVELINQYANLKAWWSRMALRPSMIATKPS
uniref:glutathione S-transferase family protein n=1 Tax=Rhizobium rhizogenes TaxID=359 RepID=UPI0019105AEF|nr:glutathione S-transferase family protein [Rhizobium rhizogenes]